MTPAPAISTASAARAARRWLLWLALVLAAAQSVAAWHAYTHAQAAPESVSKKAAHANGDTCMLCLAACGLDGAPSAGPALQLRPPPPAAVPAGCDPREAQADAARPYAIRAPPASAS